MRHLAGTELFGAERSLLDVLDQLAVVGMDVTVAVPSDENRFYVDQLRARSLAVHGIAVPARRPRHAADNEVADVYAELIAGADVDVVHVDTTIPREPLIVARRPGVPAVVHAREIPVGDSG